MPNMDRSSWWSSPRAFLVIALVVFLTDQWLKRWAMEALGEVENIQFAPLLDLALAYNYNYAFQLFDQFGLSERRLILGLSLLFCGLLFIWVIIRRISHASINIAFALIVGGGLGNLIDRISRGYVIDYWSLNSDLIVNFADCAIIVGCFLLLVFGVVIHRESESPSKPSVEEKSDED